MPPRPHARAQLLDSITPVVAANPSISLVALAGEIGVGRTTLYRHFGDAATLRTALAEHCAEALIRATEAAKILEGTGPQALRRLGSRLFDLGDVLSLIFADEPIVTDAELNEATRRMLGVERPGEDDAAEDQDPVAAVLKRCRAEDAIDPDLPVAWAAAFFWLTLASGHLYAQSGGDRHEAFALVWTAIDRTLTPPAR